ncbi:hypothetical protein JCM6882_000190 [Rhodosporidiobolus microsporus]
MADPLGQPLAELVERLKHYPTRPPRFKAIDNFVKALFAVDRDNILVAAIVLSKGRDLVGTGVQEEEQAGRAVFEAIRDVTSNDEGLLEAYCRDVGGVTRRLRVRPYEAVPCANVDEKAQKMCYNEATLECQTAHWSTHKKDCRNPLVKPGWKPNIIKPLPQSSRETTSKWNALPAFDLLRLDKNEGADFKGDLSLAWLAARDLSGLVSTLNSLPVDHPGKIGILLNHWDAPNIVRDTVILTLLSESTVDIEEAAEVAVHLNSSAFLPKMVSLLTTMTTLTDVVGNMHEAQRPEDGVHIEIDLHAKGKLTLEGDGVAVVVLKSFLERETSDDYPSDYHTFMKEPLAAQVHQKKFAQVEPGHRLALKHFYDTGIVQPFGASTFDFTKVNAILTAPNGKWVIPERASPLDAWNIDDVLNYGTSRGVRREDLFGCFYFYLVNEFRELGRRLRNFDIDVTLTVEKPDILGNRIQAGTLFPSSVRFDRIDADETVDSGKGLYEDMFKAWAPLLKRANEHATIVARPNDWPSPVKGGSVYDLPNDSHAKAVTAKLISEGKMTPNRPEGSVSSVEGEAYLNTAHGFRRYCDFVELDKHTAAANLELKERNTIVPHRILAPLDSSIDELPVFKDNEQWYRWARSPPPFLSLI